MKKSLLISLACCAAVAASASEPQILMDSYANRISPDGHYGASYYYGALKLVDLTTGEVTEILEEDPYGASDACTGSGNALSNTGIIVGTFNDLAAWFKDGEFVVLNDQIYELGTSYAQGITPDGTRIVGMYSNPANEIGNYDGTMDVPCYWDVNADGTVSEIHPLPYPDKDFTGRAPQYIFATSVSDDGETIAGQVCDYSGSFWYTILFKQNAEGEWEYSFPTESLINPEHREFPVIPAEPEYVDYQNFMTPKELAAYNAAVDDYFMGTSPDYPDFRDFMSAAELAAYNAAFAAYDAEAEEYMNAYYAFSEVFEQVMEESVISVQNSIHISPNGNLLAIGSVKPGQTFWDPSTYYVTYFNIASGEYKTYGEDIDILPNGINNAGTIFAATVQSMFNNTPVQSYVLRAGTDTFVPLLDYLSIDNQTVATWITENLTREFLTYDPETWEDVIIPEYLYTGFAIFSKDMQTIFSGVVPQWPGYEAEFSEFISYYANGMTTGIMATGVDKKEIVKVSAEKGGLLHIAGSADTVTVYDLSGREVFSSKAAATVSTGLPTGFYLVKTEGAAGVKTTKVSF